MPELTLFIIEGCPFCQRVTDYMKKASVEIPIKDISKDDEAKAQLLREGGYYQAPALRIGEHILYESADILQWMKENL